MVSRKLSAIIFLPLVASLFQVTTADAQMVNIDYDFAFKWYLYKGPSEDMGAACGDEPTTRLHLYDDNNTQTAAHNCVTVYNNGCGATGTGFHFNESAADPNGGSGTFGSYLHTANSATETVKMRWEYYEDDCGNRCDFGGSFLCGDDYHILNNYVWQIRGLTKHSIVANFGAGTYHLSEYHDGWAISTDWFGGEGRLQGNTDRQRTWTGSNGINDYNGINGKPWHKKAAMRVKYRWNYTGNGSAIQPCGSPTAVAWTDNYPSWSFQATAGNQYTFSINVTTTYGENMLRIIGSDGHTELMNTYNGVCGSCPTTLSFTAPSTGTYYVDVVNRANFLDIGGLGASNDEGVMDENHVPAGSLTYTLVSGSSPAVVLSTNNPEICPVDGEAVLTVQTSATAYIWYKDNVQFGNTLNTYTATEPGVYRVDITTGGGCLIPSNSVTITEIVTLPPPPVVTISRNSTGAVLLGQELNFTTAVVGAGTRTINYLWYDNTLDVADSTAGGIQYYPHPLTNTITYTFRARPGQKIAGGIGMYATSAGAGAGCYEAYETAESDTVALNTLIPSVTIVADREHFCVGNDEVVTLTANAVNAGPSPYYLWVKNGVEIPGANGPTYTTAPGELDVLLSGGNAHRFSVYVRPTRPACYSCLIDEVFDQVDDSKYIYHREAATSAFSVSSCYSYTVPSGDETYYADAVVTDTIPSDLGCDSVMTITIDILSCNVWDGSASTSWSDANNWSFNGVPNASQQVVIPSAPVNQPHVAGVQGECDDIIIEAGATLTVDPDGRLYIAGDIVNNGTFLIASDATGTGAMFNTGTSSGLGDFTMQQYLEGSGGATPNGRFYYISCPVAGVTASAFNLNAGNKLWRADETTQTYPQITDDGLTLGKGHGYVVRMGSTQTVSFTGTGFYSGDITRGGLTYTGSDINSGYHLVGNPYPSSYDIDYPSFQTIVPTSRLESTIWYRLFTDSDLMDVDSYNLASNTGTNLNGNGAVTGLIPGNQAFWVKVTDPIFNGIANVGFKNGVRTLVQSNIYKQAEETGTVRLILSNGQYADEAIVMFTPEASDDFDPFDSRKMWPSPVKPLLYTALGADTLVINGLLSTETNPLVDLGMKLPALGDYTLNANSITLQDEVWLEDRLLNSFQHLNSSPVYAFSSEEGNIGDRFALHFGALAVGVEQNGSATHVFATDGTVNVSVGEDVTTGSITILDIAGRTVQTAAISGSRTVVATDLITGIYLIRVETEKGVETHRVLLR